MMEVLQTAYQHYKDGDLDRAEVGYKDVLRQDPGNVHGLNLMGMLMIDRGRPVDAVELIKLALKHAPHDPQSHGNLGLALKDLGRFEEAAGHFRESLKTNPKNPVMLNNLGNALRESGVPVEAIKCFEDALRLDRGYAACWSNLAAAQRDAGNFSRAMQALDRAMELAPGLAQAHHIRGTVFAKLARFEDAVSCYDRSLELRPDTCEVLIAKSDMLREMDLPMEAESVLQQVLQIEPQNAFALHALGVLAEQVGDRNLAADYFKRSIEQAPAYTSAYYQLAQLKGRRVTETELQDMEQLWQTNTLATEARKLLAFALFRAWDQRAVSEKAWHYLTEGNRIKASASPYDAQYTRRLTDGIIAGGRRLAATDVASMASDNMPSPVFVLGMPRSGTTLTEQILASHSSVSGAGEVSYAFDCARMAASLVNKPFPDCVADLSADQLAEIGNYYMSRHRQLPVGQSWVVDKTPLNFQYIGFLAMALPQARFIHCRREPMDNLFSIHRIPFDENQTYAHSQESLADYYLQYLEMMDVWRQLFGQRILDVSYEDTVTDLEAQCRNILEFLGLNFEPQLLEFYQASGLVKTPSASQVREPIYRDAIASWKKYEEQLQPLRIALATGSAD